MTNPPRAVVLLSLRDCRARRSDRWQPTACSGEWSCCGERKVRLRKYCLFIVAEFLTRQTKARCLPFNVVGVPQIVPLTLFLDVVQHGYGGHEIHHFAGRQQVQVGTTVFPSVPVTVTRFVLRTIIRLLASLAFLYARHFG